MYNTTLKTLIRVGVVGYKYKKKRGAAAPSAPPLNPPPSVDDFNESVVHLRVMSVL